ncbi:MAG: hypothetical protein DRJ05_04925 [Bacteroidetes bacterium]|nr:MAG: hypothetical protein DRJ05_04925 [Bacteroidota bacterium]
MLLMMFGATYAQKEGAVWYFGKYAGVTFVNGDPEPLSDGALFTREGCSSISTPDGDLLFYTDGITIYNKNHNVMQNGENLSGNPSSTQSGLIVPVPDNPNYYYVFTVSNLGDKFTQEGFRYSKIDMQLDDGNGGVVPDEKNITLFDLTTERITSVKHFNEYGIWVIGHEWESNRFISYLITIDGIDTGNPVFSDVGVFHGGVNNMGKGYMKTSTGGERIAVAVQEMGVVQVFDFNNVTGEISNPITLPAGERPYGIEFSKDARYLYSDEREGFNLFQWDLAAGDEDAVINSRQTVGVFVPGIGGALQMAPNGKIYISHAAKNYLSVIHGPEVGGGGCDFEYAGFDLCENCLAQEGLPSFIQSYFNVLWIEHEHQCVDETISFSISDTANIESVLWDFGDPQSGSSNSSQLFFPDHVYTQAGKYNVLVTIVHITSSQLSGSIEIFPLPMVDLGGDQVICDGESIEFLAESGYDTYKWMDDPEMDSPTITVSEEGDYWIELTNICGVAYDTVNLTIQQLPVVDLGKDTMMVYNSVIRLDAGIGFDNYLWQDGSNLSDFILDYPGTYWVEVFDEVGCKALDTIRVEAVPFTIYVPNAFSPNGDNINDVFKTNASYEAEIKFEMSIYNRWGERVFESKSINEAWDGTYNNIPCPLGVYVWVIDASAFDENEFFSGASKMMGNVTLLR